MTRKQLRAWRRLITVFGCVAWDTEAQQWSPGMSALSSANLPYLELGGRTAALLLHPDVQWGSQTT